MSYPKLGLPRNPRLVKRDAALSRRGGMRVTAQGLCTEIAADTEQLGLLLDVSEAGIRLERPLADKQQPGARDRVVQLEFEHPGIDELIWAKGVIRFDKLEPWRKSEGPLRVRRVSGVEIVAAASRHLRMLRDFILDLRSAVKAAPDPEIEPEFEIEIEIEPARNADRPPILPPFWSSAFQLG